MEELKNLAEKLHVIRKQKKELSDKESVIRDEIVRIAEANSEYSIGHLVLNVSTRKQLKVIDPDLVPIYLKSPRPDRDRMSQYIEDTGNVPAGVEELTVSVVRVVDSSEPQ